MEDVIRVAACILNECGNLSTMKLQKLVYYSQAYHLVKHGAPLFEEDAQAWVNGPVIPKLFARHKGRFIVSRGDLGEGRLTELNPTAREAVEHVISCLGGCDGASLSALTHSENPWIEARGDCSSQARCTNEISKESVARYYASPAAAKNPVFA